MLWGLVYSYYRMQEEERRCLETSQLGLPQADPKTRIWVLSFSWEMVPGSRVKELGREGGQLLKGDTGGNRGSVHLDTL